MNKTLVLICATAAIAAALVAPTSAATRPPVDGSYYQCPNNSSILELGVDMRGTYPEFTGEYTIFHIVPESAGQSLWKDLEDATVDVGESFKPSEGTILRIFGAIGIIKLAGPATAPIGYELVDGSYREDISKNRQKIYQGVRDEFIRCSDLHPLMRYYRAVWLLRARTGLNIPLPETYRVMKWDNIYVQLDCHVAGASIPWPGENRGGPIWSLEGHRGEPPEYSNNFALARSTRCNWIPQ